MDDKDMKKTPEAPKPVSETPPGADPLPMPSQAQPERQLHPILSNKRLAEAKAAARKQLEEDRAKAAYASAYKEELQRLKIEEGLVVGGTRDEMVEVVIELVEPHVNSCLLVNFKAYWHGRTYTVPRHVADSLREQMWRLSAYTSKEIKGEKRVEFYRTQRAPVLKPSHAAA